MNAVNEGVCPVVQNPEHRLHHTLPVRDAAQEFVDSDNQGTIYGTVYDLLGKLEARWPHDNPESEWQIAKAARNAAAQPLIQAVWLDALETCLDKPEAFRAMCDPSSAPLADEQAERMWQHGDLRTFAVNDKQLAFQRIFHNLIMTSFAKVQDGKGDAAPYKVDLWRESFDYFWTATGNYLSFLEAKGLDNCSRHEQLLYQNFRHAPATAEASFRATNATNTSSALVMLAAEQRNAAHPLDGDHLFKSICLGLRKHTGLLSGKRNVSNPLIPSGDLDDPSYMQGSLVRNEAGIQTWAAPPFIKAGERYSLDPSGDCAGWMLLRVLTHRRAQVEYFRSITNGGVNYEDSPINAIRAGEIHLFIAAYVLKQMWGKEIPFV